MDVSLSPSDPAVLQQAQSEFNELRQKFPAVSFQVFVDQDLHMQASNSLPQTYPPAMYTSIMNRAHGATVDSAMNRRSRATTSQRHTKTINPCYQTDLNTHEFSAATSSSRKRPRTVPEDQLLDISEYLSLTVPENDDTPLYSPTMSELQYHDPSLLYTQHISNYSMTSPADNSPIDTPALTTASTFSPVDMSRDGSFASHQSLSHNMAMMRMNSGVSNHSRRTSHSAVHHARSRSTSHTIPSPQTSHDQNSHFAAFPSSTRQLVSSPDQSFSFPTSMARSSSSESNSSNSSTQSRVSRRHQEVSQQAQREIMPKKSDSVPAYKIKRVKSEDGTYKDKAMISRDSQQLYKRPQHPKLYCSYCEDHPDGFRGDHELTRHVHRAHPNGSRKVWVCVDSSEDGKFLANCKACRTQKKYGAYYNAAAHLRRAHFNPRKRGRKAKTEEEKRGGKGGGSWPPMDHLKENWMRELDELVTENSTLIDINASEDIDQHDDEVDFVGTEVNATAFAGGAFESTPTVSFNNFSFDNFDDSAVAIDPVNFDASPFSSVHDIPNLTYDLMSQATGMSNCTTQQYGDDNTFQAFDGSNSYAQELHIQPECCWP